MIPVIYLQKNYGEIDQEEISTVKEESSSCITEESRGITFWEPDNFNMEATTIWSFPNRGDWATHNPKYRGNWSPYIPRNIILRYSAVGGYVLDQFLGSGTTLVEAKLLNRRGIDLICTHWAIGLRKCHFWFLNIASSIQNRALSFFVISLLLLKIHHQHFINFAPLVRFGIDSSSSLYCLDFVILV